MLSFEKVIFATSVGGVPLGTYLMVGVTTLVMAFVTAYDTTSSEGSYEDYSGSTAEEEDYNDNSSGDAREYDENYEQYEQQQPQYEEAAAEPDNNLEYYEDEKERDEMPVGGEGRLKRRKRRSHTTPRSRPVNASKTLRRR